MLVLDAEAQGRRIGKVKGAPATKRMEESKHSDDDDEDDMKPMLCPNCKQMIQPADIAMHTVACYRNSTKCRVCGEIIQKDKKREHLAKFKDYDVRNRDVQIL